MTKVEDLLIGAHTSAAGGVHNALIEGKSIGATTIQLFTSNQRQWKAKELSEHQIDLFKETLDETGLEQIMSHASYLVNLGSPDDEAIEKSRNAFRKEIERCLALGITYLNFHPGAALTSSRQECLDRIIESLISFADLFDDNSTRLLLETTAGQGSTVGDRFEDLGYIIRGVQKQVPIGVCIDTCHIFAAGYDIRTADSWRKTLDTFENEVGLDHLYAFHLNDSMKELASKRDRHAPLGEGEIGLESFRYLMNNQRTRELPKYLETPGGCPLWDKEIWMLREFAKKK